MTACRKQKKFLVKWVTDHMDDSEENTHKPLLLEEFGKIVWEKDFVKGMIEKKRNPVYEAMTGVTTDSVYRCDYAALHTLRQVGTSIACVE